MRSSKVFCSILELVERFKRNAEFMIDLYGGGTNKNLVGIEFKFTFLRNCF